jgi:hypothetical protein
LGELPLVEPRVPELTNELIDLGLVAAPARALDVMHPSLSPDSEQIGNHGVHRTLTFVLIGSGLEGPECEGRFGLDAFSDVGEGIAWEAAFENSQEPVADQGQMGQERSVSAPRPVRPHPCIPLPRVVVFYAGPMTSDQSC